MSPQWLLGSNSVFNSQSLNDPVSLSHRFLMSSGGIPPPQHSPYLHWMKGFIQWEGGARGIWLIIVGWVGVSKPQNNKKKVDLLPCRQILYHMSHEESPSLKEKYFNWSIIFPTIIFFLFCFLLLMFICFIALHSCSWLNCSWHFN